MAGSRFSSCKGCGTDIPDTMTICPWCGYEDNSYYDSWFDQNYTEEDDHIIAKKIIAKKRMNNKNRKEIGLADLLSSKYDRDVRLSIADIPSLSSVEPFISWVFASDRHYIYKSGPNSSGYPFYYLRDTKNPFFFRNLFKKTYNRYTDHEFCCLVINLRPYTDYIVGFSFNSEAWQEGDWHYLLNVEDCGFDNPDIGGQGDFFSQECNDFFYSIGDIREFGEIGTAIEGSLWGRAFHPRKKLIRSSDYAVESDDRFSYLSSINERIGSGQKIGLADLLKSKFEKSTRLPIPDIPPMPISVTELPWQLQSEKHYIYKIANNSTGNFKYYLRDILQPFYFQPLYVKRYENGNQDLFCLLLDFRPYTDYLVGFSESKQAEERGEWNYLLNVEDSDIDWSELSLECRDLLDAGKVFEPQDYNVYYPDQKQLCHLE